MTQENATGGQPVAGMGMNQSHNGSQPHHTTGEADSQEPILADLHSLLAAAKVQPPDDPGKLWTAADLLSHSFPEPNWAVPNLIPAGLNILAGRPKIGKSWLVLQTAIAAGSGGMVLGERVERRNVLYLALEDSQRRLQERLRLQSCPPGASIEFITQWPALIESGLEHLQKLIEKNGYGLVIVDTLARWAGLRKLEDEQLVTQRLSELQRYATQRNLTVLLVDHHRKAGASSVTDVIDDVMGATSKTGMADAALGLYRQRGQQGAELKITGRDVLDRELAVTFDHQTMCWQLLGDAAGVKANTLQGEILESLAESFSGECTATDLARYLNRDRSNVRKEMIELAARGRLIKVDQKQGREVRFKVMAEPAPSYTEREERERI